MSRRPHSAALLFACIVLLLVPQRSVTVGAQSPDPFAGFDAFVDGVMKEWRVPGLAVGAIRDGRVVLAKGYGHRNIEKQLPVTSRTLMGIGSNSKSFTVTLMGMLSDAGKLDWDKRVRAYLPDFELQDDIATRLMTPTDLVTHRSGLPRHEQVWLVDIFSRQELFARLRHLEPSTSFRQRYQYSNLMFMAAGVLLERMTNQTWDDLIKQKIFTPLGMTRSNTSVRDMPTSDDYSLPYVARLGVTAVPYRNFDAIAPAAAINASVDDMLKYVQMHIDLGAAGGQQIISKAFAARMQSPHSAFAQSADDDLDGEEQEREMGPGGYGLGVSVRSYRGHKFVSHDGGVEGFISAMSWMPHERIGVVVLSNLSGPRVVPNIVQLNVYERLLGLSLTDHVRRAKERQARTQKQNIERERQRQAQRVAGTAPSRPLAQFAGRYEHPGYGPLTIVEKDGKLTLIRGSRSLPLEHFHYDVFREGPAVYSGRRMVRFTAGPSGQIEAVSIPLEPAVTDIVFRRKATD